MRAVSTDGANSHIRRQTAETGGDDGDWEKRGWALQVQPVAKALRAGEILGYLSHEQS